MKSKQRICAWLMTIATLIGILPTGVLADTPGVQPNGLENYVVELSSDPSTSTKPTTFGTAADDGRVWADKSVVVNSNGKDFDVELSALAQEYVRTSVTSVREQAAADVAMVLDMSGSMTADRVTRMKDAVNKGIDIIMAANPRNRIGIYYYGLSTGTNTGTLFPLASYSTTETGDGTDAVDRYITSSAQTITRKAGITQKYLDGATGTTTSQTIATSNATATQFGLYTAIKALKDDIASRPKSSLDTERVPYVLLLTDGEANRSYVNWYNSPPNGTERAGSGASGTAEIAALTILSAAKLKEELRQAYSEHSGGKDAVWFNIAFGLTEGNNLATASLKPELVNSASTSTLGQVYTQLNTYTNSAPAEYKKYGLGGTPGYLYAQEYIYFVSPTDLSKVDEAISDLAGLVESATQEKIIPFDPVNEYGETVNLMITDVLGDGMVLKSMPELYTSDYEKISGTVKSVSGFVTTYQFAGFESTVEYDSATATVKWMILPNEIPLIMFFDRKYPTPGSYSNPNLNPLSITYTVGLSNTYAGGDFYSNKYSAEAETLARYTPAHENPYYYKNIELDGTGAFSSSVPKMIGSDLTDYIFKTSNTTQTALYSYMNIWNGSEFITRLGNNGIIEQKINIEKSTVSGSVQAGGNVDYNITISNLTDSSIYDVVISDELPTGLTFVSGSIKENSISMPSATFPYTISSIPAKSSIILSLQATVSPSSIMGTEYINEAKIISVDGTTLIAPATVNSNKITVSDTFTPSVAIKIDGVNYTGQTVTLWKDGVMQYTLSESSGIHTISSVTPDTYDIYVNAVNAGIQLSASDSNKEINYYSVSFFDGANKYDTPAAQIILMGEKSVFPAAPMKSGYTFDKWVTTNGGAIPFDFDIPITNTTNVYATWIPNTNTAYKVNHYQANMAGSYPATPTLVEDLSGTTGGTTSAAAKVYTGFTAVAFSQETIAADGSTAVNIYYERNLYDITFVIDPNKGTTTDDTTPEVPYGGTPTAPGITDQPGYAFTGWDKTIDPVTGDETYTAEFDLVDFSIAYNLDGGSVAVANPDSYTIESSSITLNNPTKTGYTFGGWTGTGLGSATSAVTIAQGSTGDRSYTATWIPIRSGGGSTIKYYAVTFDAAGGNTTPAKQTVVSGGFAKGPTDPTKESYTFLGWYTADGNRWDFGADTVRANVTLTAKWQRNNIVPELDKFNHFAYMQGYPEGDFRAEMSMTRAEAVVMFSRLLVKKMDVDSVYKSKFSDVAGTEWYANSVGYMEQFNIISGYPDGTFGGNEFITRAEFATIAARFDRLTTGELNMFSDVSDDYWAKDSISFATSKGWIKGYTDDTFRPSNNITRAEVVTLVNRMLERNADKEYVDSNQTAIKQYFDLNNTHWAYYDIHEASNGHDYVKSNGIEEWSNLK